MTKIVRETRETRIALAVHPDGDTVEVDTGDRFLDHMLETLSRYGGLGLTVEASGDLHHHLVEDVAIALGLALAREVQETAARYGSFTVPMDDALVHAALDAGGRPYYEGELPSDIYQHFFRSLVGALKATLHVRVLRGRDEHHVVEAAMKATGMALRQALRDAGDVFSTKGSVSIRWEDR